jgi:hypothetical protein
MLNTQTSAVALDLLENGIGAERTGRHGALPAAIWGIPESLGAVHDGHERSAFGKMQASRRPNQR